MFDILNTTLCPFHASSCLLKLTYRLLESTLAFPPLRMSSVNDYLERVFCFYAYSFILELVRAGAIETLRC
jgi:hypothetical protein